MHTALQRKNFAFKKKVSQLPIFVIRYFILTCSYIGIYYSSQNFVKNQKMLCSKFRTEHFNMLLHQAKPPQNFYHLGSSANFKGTNNTKRQMTILQNVSSIIHDPR